MTNSQDKFKEHHKVPDAYFDSIETQVQNALSQRIEQKAFYLKPVFTIGIASLLALVSYFSFYNESEALSYEVSNDQIANYLVSEMSTEELMEDYAEYYFTSADDNEIEDYLLNEEVELNSLIDEY